MGSRGGPDVAIGWKAEAFCVRHNNIFSAPEMELEMQEGGYGTGLLSYRQSPQWRARDCQEGQRLAVSARVQITKNPLRWMGRGPSMRTRFANLRHGVPRGLRFSL